MNTKDGHSGGVMTEGSSEDQLGCVCKVQREMMEAWVRGMSVELIRFLA